ncbi:MAG: spore germination protein amino acid permease [Neobacillus sp.]|jgi:spore germination protein KB|nr:spore germination protein amino acid permease [Neobacillus sp.]
MEKISRYQLFSLVMMEQIGSTYLWALGIEAKRDTWLVILFSLLPGCALVWIFTELHRHFPNDNIAGVTTKLLGVPLGWPLALIFAFTDIFNTTRNTSEFTDLLNMTFLQNTPSIVVTFIFLTAIIYILFMGIETLARLTQIILPIHLILIFIIYFLVITSGMVDFSQLTPILENGLAPILHASYPDVVNYPFGFSILFMQFWLFSNAQKSVRKVSLLAVILSGLLLTFTQAIIVSTLGVASSSRLTLPILEVIKLVHIGDIFTNFEVLGILLILVGGFYMAIFNILSASLILSSLFKVNDYRWILVPLAVFILWYSRIYEPNYPFHVQFLRAQSWQQFVPLYNFIPIVLLIIYWLKKQCTK